MISGNDILTARLKLRQWRDEDLPLFARMSNDPRVMAYFPNLLTQQQSDELARHLAQKIHQQGWGVWVIETLGTRRFVGIAGLNSVADNLPFSPAVEALWRVDPALWRLGYGYEAAHAALQFGFESLALDGIVALTHTGNLPSISLMQKLGMTCHGEFEHPALPVAHRLRPHVLYRLAKEAQAIPV
ncbi:Uncharacterised protein [BD1-7 clade bacterium]|uniref:N-acetyltransferase domain-containing protein n=1 Tax=BD1-7 clade bacterium TaxID=2029982 RepID=A0A5S9Q7Y3_9GAMM|nr:Uncharacterised protein [BD1-7 clade bacterium]CAA0113154.1 Uncharacterised protein [BD1-7 clade bacterium]